MGFKSYFLPGKAGKNKTEQGEENLHGMVEMPIAPIFPSAGFATPADFPSTYLSGANTPGKTSSIPSYAAGDFRNATMTDINDIKCDVMVNYLHQHQAERLWTMHGEEEGVVLKKSRGEYACAPEELMGRETAFVRAIEMLNVRVAMSVNTKVIKLFLRNNRTHFVPLSNGLRLQVLPDISYLPRCQKHHFAAFIADRGQLVVWDDNPRHILGRAEKIEAELMDMIWQGSGFNQKNKTGKKGSQVAVDCVSTSDQASDLEKQFDNPRPIVLWQPLHVAFVLLLSFACLGTGWARLALEIKVDNQFTRAAFVIASPAQIWLGLFFFQALVGNVFQIVGPTSQMNKNSKYYSGVAPTRLNRDSRASLPHVTIQMPVYKEGLATVIQPTIRSVKTAISTYEMQGGTANIFVNDDGMQLISDDAARARQDFYDEHNIGWVARPKHNPKPAEGEQIFLRRGKFKKASNMNYAMWVSSRVEEKLVDIDRPDSWTVENETDCFREALETVVAEDEGRTWAEGNIRMGDYILLIDSDTRVPVDCFLDAVSEMEQSPQVAIIQYASGVMNVTSSFFEKGITFFTNLVYTQIRYAVANGDVAPFVGHNAILRWSAVQQISYDCRDDHREKFWSEATVSEDFDMALRLQTAGYLVRLGAYTDDGFKEGVSLTVYDELARWEKYAYGCSELIFHPLRHWPTRGPLTPLFRRFISSTMPFPGKMTILGYVGTYYALGSAWLLTLLNYFLTGWFNGFLDHYYIDSFKIYFAIVLVFTALGNASLAILRYRISEKGLLASLWENFKWIPLLSIFLGGVSLHVSQAILSHMFSVDMSWGATAKEAENTKFFEEIPKVLKRFKGTFLFAAGVTVMMVVLAQVVPSFWQIRLFIAIWPLGTIVFGHFFLPIALNPNLMLFMW